ncbi:hypothetical protein GCM10022381_19340 [Leifsonia kafniensis]|uniref:Uncharacterized protein n=1 Tax=Leifsonia kafniensis TaxID=475957 RepID=A0ABP7KH59_9MICO
MNDVGADGIGADGVGADRVGADESRPRPPGHRWTGPTVANATKSVIAMAGVYRTEYAIYGTVLVSALIAVGWKFNTDWEVLVFTVGTIGVFWLAHIYSGVVAREETIGPRWKAISHAAYRSAQHSVGMVVAMLLPAFFLLLAVMGLLDEYVAYYIALWVGVGILAVLGFVNSARRGQRWGLRLLSAAATSLLGLAVIWLSTLVH